MCNPKQILAFCNWWPIALFWSTIPFPSMEDEHSCINLEARKVPWSLQSHSCVGYFLWKQMPVTSEFFSFFFLLLYESPRVELWIVHGNCYKSRNKLIVSTFCLFVSTVALWSFQINAWKWNCVLSCTFHVSCNTYPALTRAGNKAIATIRLHSDIGFISGKKKWWTQ